MRPWCRISTLKMLLHPILMCYKYAAGRVINIPNYASCAICEAKGYTKYTPFPGFSSGGN